MSMRMVYLIAQLLGLALALAGVVILWGWAVAALLGGLMVGTFGVLGESGRL